MTALDYVLYDRSRRGLYYHRPVYVAAIKAACGSSTMFQFDPVDEEVAIRRYKASRCGRCWR